MGAGCAPRCTTAPGAAGRSLAGTEHQIGMEKLPNRQNKMKKKLFVNARWEGLQLQRVGELGTGPGPRRDMARA